MKPAAIRPNPMIRGLIQQAVRPDPIWAERRSNSSIYGRSRAGMVGTDLSRSAFSMRGGMQAHQVLSESTQIGIAATIRPNHPEKTLSGWYKSLHPLPERARKVELRSEAFY
jgi:hypothetical protein